MVTVIKSFTCAKEVQSSSHLWDAGLQAHTRKNDYISLEIMETHTLLAGSFCITTMRPDTNDYELEAAAMLLLCEWLLSKE